MNVKGIIRPSKPISALVVIFGMGFIFIGFTEAIPSAGLYGWFWMFGAFSITGYHLFNLLTKNGVAEEVFDASPSNYDQPNGAMESSVEIRLQRLEKLKRSRRIDEKEYQQQRQRILHDI